MAGLIGHGLGPARIISVKCSLWSTTRPYTVIKIHQRVKSSLAGRRDGRRADIRCIWRKSLLSLGEALNTRWSKTGDQITVERISVADEAGISSAIKFVLSQSQASFVERRLSFVLLISGKKHADSRACVSCELIQPLFDQFLMPVVQVVIHHAVGSPNLCKGLERVVLRDRPDAGSC